MNRMKPAAVSALAVALALFVASPVLAQTTGQAGSAEHNQHHPQTPSQAAPSAPAAPGQQSSGASGNMGGGMMGGDMGRMMQMMHGRMGAAGGMGGGAMMGLHRVEGRLAYARAELKITEAQSAAWSAFADVVRVQHHKLHEAMAKAMSPMMPMGERQPVTAPQQMERRIAALSVQLDAMRAVATAAQPLYAMLSEEQRRTADELMAEHFRSMRMAGM